VQGDTGECKGTQGSARGHRGVQDYFLHSPYGLHSFTVSAFSNLTTQENVDLT